jgi:hypothetical protein
MIEAFAQVNWLAILTASIAHFVLGGVWFKVLFRDAYAAALSLSDRLQTKPAPSFLIGPFLCGTVNIVTTALLLRALRIATYADALVLGSIVGVSYLAAVNIAINPLFPQPFRYSLVVAPMFVVGRLMTSVALIAMS